MASAGTDARTGRILRDFDHVVQSVDRLFSFRLGELVMLRGYATGLSELLGRRMTGRLVGAYISLLALSIKIFEPRLQVVAVKADNNAIDDVRLGELRFVVQVYYRPNALRGDFTVEGGMRQIGIAGSDGRISLKPLNA